MAAGSTPDDAAAFARLKERYGGREQVMEPAAAIVKAADLVGHVIYQVAATAGGSRRHGPPDIDPEDVRAALRLIPTVRAAADRLETSILTAARTCDLTWREIAESLGLDSPQAAAQRWGRLSGSDMSKANLEN